MLTPDDAIRLEDEVAEAGLIAMTKFQTEMPGKGHLIPTHLPVHADRDRLRAAAQAFIAVVADGWR